LGERGEVQFKSDCPELVSTGGKKNGGGGRNKKMTKRSRTNGKGEHKKKTRWGKRHSKADPLVKGNRWGGENKTKATV